MTANGRTRGSAFQSLLAPLLVLTGLFWAGLCSGQSLGLDVNSETDNQPQVLDPRDLRAGWWGYIEDAPPAESAARIAELGERIDQAVLSLSVSDVGQMVEQAALAKLHLQALLDEQSREIPKFDVTVRISGSFFLEDLFAINASIRETEISVQDVAGTITDLAEVIKQERLGLDERLLTYRGVDPNSVNRISEGIQIITAQAELAVLTLKHQRAKSRKASLTAYLGDLKQQLAYAKAHLDASSWSFTSAISDQAALATRIDESLKRVATRRRDILEVDDSSLQGRVLAKLVRQQLFAEMLSLAELRLHEVTGQASILWYRLRRDEEPPTLAEIETQLADLNRQAKPAIDEFQGLRRATETLLLEASEVGSAPAAREVRRNEQRGRDLAVKNLQQFRELGTVVSQALLMRDLLVLEMAASDKGFAGFLRRTRVAIGLGWESAQRWGNVTLFHVSDNPVTPGALFQVLLIVLITFLISKVVRKGLQRVRDQGRIADAHSIYAVSRIAHYVIVVAGLLFGLSTLGLDFTSVALIAGALSVGIGFGLQTTVNNFVSGLILLFDRSLKVGDYVELDSGLRGTVREISVRATRINTNDNVDVVVPNSEFVSTRLINWTLKESYARLRIRFGVAYGTDKEKVRQVAIEATERVEVSLTHMPLLEPQVRLVGFGDSSLDFELLVWVNRSGVNRPGRARAQYLWELETGLSEAGIEIPFPQRDLHLRSGLPQQDHRQNLED